MASDEKQTAVYKVVREAAMKHRRVTVSEGPGMQKAAAPKESDGLASCFKASLQPGN